MTHSVFENPFFLLIALRRTSTTTSTDSSETARRSSTRSRPSYPSEWTVGGTVLWRVLRTTTCTFTSSLGVQHSRGVVAAAGLMVAATWRSGDLEQYRLVARAKPVLP